MDPDYRLYSIQPTPYGGRGVYARTDISAGTCILRCPGPYAYVIARKFRKEVCAWCFSYAFEHGKRVWSWKYESTDSISLRDDQECIGKTVSPVHNSKQNKGNGANTAANLAGTWFCTAECRTRWCLEMDFGRLHASLLGMLEKLHITASDKKRGSADIPVTAADAIAIEGGYTFPLLKTLQPYWIHSKDALLSASHLKNPSTLSAGREEQITSCHQTLSSCQRQLDIVWSHAELVYARGYYRNAAPGEPRKEEPLSEFELDTARFAISALVQFFWEGSAAAHSNRGLDQNGSVMTWTDMLELQNNEVETALRKPEILATQVRVYGFVRSVVETALRTPGVMPAGAYDWGKLRAWVDKSDYVRAILGRDHGNVFGIWDMATEGDSEMLGWGMYIQGSYFNHDCAPNVKKRRVGRALEFYAMRNIATGEELCTTYVDVDEPASQRCAELREQWYFNCVCVRCRRELEVPIDEGTIDSGYVSSVDN
ncbi:hypothetical protein M378DRAFT_126067 [Amanita muscaria Koide BX008]|uniref:SET domain-containing protein n=1 Tax=Amanita muscaria (strain Koide BX008) TaxID=946122 RepID=A0A0C2WTK2_AMAMK|nr:hypothetical protein M378DRAFT_126067 [Amanita muscaria Koide BX008]